jgi:hypothetical protein
VGLEPDLLSLVGINEELLQRDVAPLM